MKTNASKSTRSIWAFTVPEVMVAVGLGGVILAVIGVLSVYGLRSFVAISNYTDLDAKSRKALDELSQELRECDTLTGLDASTNSPWFQFTNTTAKTSIKVGWNPQARVVTATRVNSASTTSIATNLTECDYWHYDLYQQTPTEGKTNEFNLYQGGVNRCKLINMTWKCSRVIMGKKWQTESVQTAKIVMRNAR